MAEIYVSLLKDISELYEESIKANLTLVLLQFWRNYLLMII